MCTREKLDAWIAAYALERQWIDIQWDNLHWVEHWIYQYEDEYWLPWLHHGYWKSIVEGS